ncbi:cell division protein FtsQ/DivIB [Egbenema bharatensis]|uniref:cell division protein FtsQ/DivIB n=1 Tax=Egbenema bharatensis TaxID=3463334 RepID=UPI003A848B81
MAEISSTSQSELASRRQQLRRQRRVRTLQSTWQMVAMAGITGGLIWGLSQLDWMLRGPQQVAIEGNQVLSSENIRSILPIDYPQSILLVQPQKIAHHLETEAPIATATVVRHLFPPGLTVRIQERYPVAVAYFASPIATMPAPSNQTSPAQQGQPSQQQAVLLDEEGAVIPFEVYVSLNSSQGLPDLKIIGMREEYRSQWANLYQQVSRSPVKITEIDWRNPSNLVLHTELGMVDFGAYSSRLAEQLQVLDQMRQLPEQVDLDQVAYIDLRNPKHPLIEMTDIEGIRPAVDE